MQPMITEFPIPVCNRLTPVPAADLTWINHKWGKDYPTLAKDEQARSKSRVISGLRGTYPLLSKPIHLKKGNESTFPSTDDFILARAEIGEGGVVPATIRNLDLKILDNHVGYSRMPGGEAYYFQKNLQCKKRARNGI